nr:hypothetical protein [Sphingomonas bacterium]
MAGLPAQPSGISGRVVEADARRGHARRLREPRIPPVAARSRGEAAVLERDAGTARAVAGGEGELRELAIDDREHADRDGRTDPYPARLPWPTLTDTHRELARRNHHHARRDRIVQNHYGRVACAPDHGTVVGYRRPVIAGDHRRGLRLDRHDLRGLVAVLGAENPETLVPRRQPVVEVILRTGGRCYGRERRRPADKDVGDAARDPVRHAPAPIDRPEPSVCPRPSMLPAIGGNPKRCPRFRHLSMTRGE